MLFLNKCICLCVYCLFYMSGTKMMSYPPEKRTVCHLAVCVCIYICMFLPSTEDISVPTSEPH